MSRHICSEVGVDLDLEDEDDSKCVFVSDGIWKVRFLCSGNRFAGGVVILVGNWHMSRRN